MTMRNKTTNIYTEWLPLVETLPNEIAGVIFKNILKYQNGEDINSDFPVWMFIKSKIDEYNSKLDEIREKRKKSGSCGGLAKSSKCYQMLESDSKCSNKIKENKIKQNKIKENSYNKYGELTNQVENHLENQDTFQVVDKDIVNINNILNNFKSNNSFSNSKIRIDENLNLLEIDDKDIPLYVDEYGEKVVCDVQNWLLRNKMGQVIEKEYIVRQFKNFAYRQGVAQ